MNLQDRMLAYSISSDANLAGVLVLHEPSPATALNASKGSVHLGLEVTKATVGGVNGLGKGTRGQLTTTGALGSKVLPEEGVVKVTTAVEVDGGLKGDLGSNVALVLGFLELLNRVVVVGHVGVVVVLVVDLHDLAGDGGLQSTVVILQHCVSSCLLGVGRQKSFLGEFCSQFLELTGKIRKGGLAAGEGETGGAGLGGSRNTRAKGNAGGVVKESSHYG